MAINQASNNPAIQRVAGIYNIHQQIRPLYQPANPKQQLIAKGEKPQ